MIENFLYNDIVLYSKGWYEKSDDICKDLGYLFSKIYGWTPTSEQDVADFMLRVIDKLYEAQGRMFKADSYMSCFAGFHNEVRRDIRLYDLSYDKAVIYVSLNILSQLSRDDIKLNPPHYGKKEHFRMGMLFGSWPKSMTYAEMNKRAQQAFNDKQ